MKNYATIKVPLAMERGSNPVVQMTIVDVAPHLPGTWAVHRHRYEGRRFWRITNVETGYYISQGDAPTRAGCLRKAKKYLAQQTSECLIEQMDKAIKAGGRKITPCKCDSELNNHGGSV